MPRIAKIYGDPEALRRSLEGTKFTDPVKEADLIKRRLAIVRIHFASLIRSVEESDESVARIRNQIVR